MKLKNKFQKVQQTQKLMKFQKHKEQRHFKKCHQKWQFSWMKTTIKNNKFITIVNKKSIKQHLIFVVQENMKINVKNLYIYPWLICKMVILGT